KLRGTLRGYDIIMAAEVHRSIRFADEAQDALALHARVRESKLLEPRANQLHGPTVILTGRILGRDGDQLLGPLHHRIAMRPDGFEQRGVHVSIYPKCELATAPATCRTLRFCFMPESPITPRTQDFAAWYQDVVLQGDMA